MGVLRSILSPVAILNASAPTASNETIPPTSPEACSGSLSCAMWIASRQPRAGVLSYYSRRGDGWVRSRGRRCWIGAVNKKNVDPRTALLFLGRFSLLLCICSCRCMDYLRFYWPEYKGANIRIWKMSHRVITPSTICPKIDI